MIDQYGTIGYTEDEVITALRQNPDLDITNVFLCGTSKYQNSSQQPFLDMPVVYNWDDRTYAVSPEEFHKQLQSEWFMPENYKNFDIQQWLLDKCNSDIEVTRVQSELHLFEQMDLLPMLRYLKYIRDLAQENNIVWGIGRGSACASYCLYLMKIHMVNCIEFGLDIQEFLKVNNAERKYE